MWTPKIFYKDRALSLLYPYDALTSCKKLEKTNERSLKYLKTDGRTNGPRTRAITKDPLGRTWGLKRNIQVKKNLGGDVTTCPYPSPLATVFHQFG